MPRVLGRLWRGGRRRTRTGQTQDADRERKARERTDMQQRIEEARQRLREAIPSPEDPGGDDAESPSS